MKNPIKRIAASAIITTALYAQMAVGGNDGDYQAVLAGAWSDFTRSMKAAEQSLLDPRYAAPTPSPRVLADGYKYLLGHLNREIEYQLRADPKFPEFFRSMDMLRKWTGENPDTMYLKAPIDSSGYYRAVIDSAAGSGQGRFADVQAPRMVTLQTITGVPGNTGELAEMHNCKDQTLDYISGFDFEASPFPIEILVGPERPKDYKGLFLATIKDMSCAGTGEVIEAHAKMLSVREVFSDWSREVPLDLSIERLDAQGANRPVFSPQDMAARIRIIGENVTNQIRFWNRLMAGPMELYSDTNGDDIRAMPVNGINQPSLPFTAGGVAGARQLYAAGIFDIAADEALVIRLTAPVEPHYVGFQLNNLWMEGPDQQNYVSSLTGHQNPIASDGSRYYVIAHTDPGVRGWVDTTGLEYGFHCFRFIFREQLQEDRLPTITVAKVKVDQLQDHLPDDVEQVTREQRLAEISVRQQHIKQRWRNY